MHSLRAGPYTLHGCSSSRQMPIGFMTGQLSWMARLLHPALQSYSHAFIVACVHSCMHSLLHAAV